MTLGALISFYVARHFGRDYFQRRFIQKIERLKDYNEKLEKHGFFTVLMLRLISLIPFELINIFAGLSRTKFWDFILGTFIGIVPGTIITIYFVKSLDKVGSFEFYASFLLLAGFSLLPLLFKKVRKIIFGMRN